MPWRTGLDILKGHPTASDQGDKPMGSWAGLPQSSPQSQCSGSARRIVGGETRQLTGPSVCSKIYANNLNL